MHADKTVKLSAPVSYRPPKHLHAEFLSRVQRSGISACAFITQSIFGKDPHGHVPPRQSRRPPVEKVELAKLLAACAAIRDELKRCDHADDAEMRHAVRASTEALQDIRSILFKLMGRRP